MNEARASDLAARMRRVISARLGLDLEQAPARELLDLIGARRGSQSAENYVAALELRAPVSEVEALARELTVGETYFFRHSQQFDAFVRVALPQAIERNRSVRELRLLSAGCASGEEAYTLAILVREQFLEPDWHVAIRALDVNPRVIGLARRGVYSNWSLRETSAETRRRWFRSAADPRAMELAPAIRAMVDFQQGNLVENDDALLGESSYDVIFCRNVLMYFTRAQCELAVARLSRALVPGGHLFLGHAENLRGISSDFDLCQSHDSFYYRRRSKTSLPQPERERSTTTSTAPSTAEAAGGSGAATTDWFGAISQASARIASLSASGEAPSSRARPLTSVAPPAPPARSRELNQAFELFRREQFEDALAAVRALPPGARLDAEVRLLEAVLLVQSGRLDEAAVACRVLLAKNERDAAAHYLLALCQESGGDPDAAARHHQTAAHLDPTFAMPRIHLGLLLRRRGRRDAARSELLLGRELLEREDPQRVLLFGGGFDRASLLALCTAELNASGGAP